MTLEADFLKHVLDWSTLFSVQGTYNFPNKDFGSDARLDNAECYGDIDLTGGIGALDIRVKCSMKPKCAYGIF